MCGDLEIPQNVQLRDKPTEKKELCDEPENLALEDGKAFISNTMQSMVENGQYDMRSSIKSSRAEYGKQ